MPKNGAFRQPIVHRRLPRARRLGEDGCQFVIGSKINATVHNTASPETFRDWRIDSSAKPAA